MMNALKALVRGAWFIALKDLRTEARTGEITSSAGLFAVLIVVVASLSFFVDDFHGRVLAPGVLWIAIAFAGVLAVARLWGRERDNDAMRALVAAPVPRASIFLGKAAGAFIFVTAIELVIVPLVAVLLQVDLTHVAPSLSVIIMMATFGFVTMGALFGAMTVRTSGRDLMLSVVLFPLVAPALLAAVVATREILAGATVGELWGWIRILAAFDALALSAGLWLSELLFGE